MNYFDKPFNSRFIIDLLLILLASMIIAAIFATIVRAEEQTTNIWTTTPSMATTSTQSQWILSITDDGQLEINGKSVEKMSDPEIKLIMREVALWIRQHGEESSLIQQYDRQTGYLLQELEKCHKDLQK